MTPMMAPKASAGSYSHGVSAPRSARKPAMKPYPRAVPST